jgi:hypothetical protein
MPSSHLGMTSVRPLRRRIFDFFNLFWKAKVLGSLGRSRPAPTQLGQRAIHIEQDHAWAYFATG